VAAQGVIGAIIVVAIALVTGETPFAPSARRLSAVQSRLLFPVPAAIAGSRAHDTSGPPTFRQDIAAGLAHLTWIAATKNG
jgi:hypothetical protein